MSLCPGSQQSRESILQANPRSKGVSISVSPLGPEEPQPLVADILGAGVRQDATIYIPIAASGRLKLHQEQKWTGMQESELAFGLSLAAGYGNLSCSSLSWPLNSSIRPSSLARVSRGVLSVLAGEQNLFWVYCPCYQKHQANAKWLISWIKQSIPCPLRKMFIRHVFTVFIKMVLVLKEVYVHAEL